MKTSKEKYEYDKNYAKEKLQQIKLSLNKETDAELISWIEKQQNKQGYIKMLIREDMKRSNK